jgi:hypothetical protein
MQGNLHWHYNEILGSDFWEESQYKLLGQKDLYE